MVHENENKSNVKEGGSLEIALPAIALSGLSAAALFKMVFSIHDIENKETWRKMIEEENKEKSENPATIGTQTNETNPDKKQLVKDLLTALLGKINDNNNVGNQTDKKKLVKELLVALLGKVKNNPQGGQTNEGSDVKKEQIKKLLIALLKKVKRKTVQGGGGGIKHAQKGGDLTVLTGIAFGGISAMGILQMLWASTQLSDEEKAMKEEVEAERRKEREKESKKWTKELDTKKKNWEMKEAKKAKEAAEKEAAKAKEAEEAEEEAAARKEKGNIKSLLVALLNKILEEKQKEAVVAKEEKEVDSPNKNWELALKLLGQWKKHNMHPIKKLLIALLKKKLEAERRSEKKRQEEKDNIKSLLVALLVALLNKIPDNSTNTQSKDNNIKLLLITLLLKIQCKGKNICPMLYAVQKDAKEMTVQRNAGEEGTVKAPVKEGEGADTAAVKDGAAETDADAAAKQKQLEETARLEEEKAKKQREKEAARLEEERKQRKEAEAARLKEERKIKEEAEERKQREEALIEKINTMKGKIKDKNTQGGGGRGICSIGDKYEQIEQSWELKTLGNALEEEKRSPYIESLYTDNSIVDQIINNVESMNHDKGMEKLQELYNHLSNIYSILLGSVRIYCKLFDPIKAELREGEDEEIEEGEIFTRGEGDLKTLSINTKVKCNAMESEKECKKTDGIIEYEGFDEVYYTKDDIFEGTSEESGDNRKAFRDIVDNIASDNVTIFGYGFSGSGKTFSLGLDPGNFKNGLLYKSLNHLKDNGYKISLAECFEIYGTIEATRTMENPIKFNIKDRKLDIDGDIKNQINVILEEKSSELLDMSGNIEEIGVLRKEGKEGKEGKDGRIATIKATPNNKDSSRSHLFLKFNVKEGDKDAGKNLTFIDMGGSENIFDILDTYIEYNNLVGIHEIFKGYTSSQDNIPKLIQDVSKNYSNSYLYETFLKNVPSTINNYEDLLDKADITFDASMNELYTKTKADEKKKEAERDMLKLCLSYVLILLIHPGGVSGGTTGKDLPMQTGSEYNKNIGGMYPLKGNRVNKVMAKKYRFYKKDNFLNLLFNTFLSNSTKLKKNKLYLGEWFRSKIENKSNIYPIINKKIEEIKVICQEGLYIQESINHLTYFFKKKLNGGKTDNMKFKKTQWTPHLEFKKRTGSNFETKYKHFYNDVYEKVVPLQKERFEEFLNSNVRQSDPIPYRTSDYFYNPENAKKWENDTPNHFMMQFAQETNEKECTKFIMLFCMGLGYRGTENIVAEAKRRYFGTLNCLEQSQEMICLDPATSEESTMGKVEKDEEGQCKTKMDERQKILKTIIDKREDPEEIQHINKLGNDGDIIEKLKNKAEAFIIELKDSKWEAKIIGDKYFHEYTYSNNMKEYNWKEEGKKGGGGFIPEHLHPSNTLRNYFEQIFQQS